MGSVDSIKLMWNEYEPKMRHEFSQLRNDEDFYDVTIVCGGSMVKAHKVILGACSTFFKSLIKYVPHQHPLLYLGGVDFNCLEAVLEFMYNGEVHVRSDELDRFLTVAQELKVKGLMNCSSSEKRNDSSQEAYEKTLKRSVKRKSLSTSSIPSKQRMVTQETNDDAEIQEIIPIDRNTSLSENEILINNGGPVNEQANGGLSCCISTIQSGDTIEKYSAFTAPKNGITLLEKNDEIQEITSIEGFSSTQASIIEILDDDKFKVEIVDEMQNLRKIHDIETLEPRDVNRNVSSFKRPSSSNPKTNVGSHAKKSKAKRK